MIKIGLLGVGHLGKIHLKLLQEIDGFELVGFYDPNDENSGKVISTYDIQRFGSLNELIKQVDAVDIVTPTLSHYDCAIQAVKNGKHIFIEKPVTNTLKEAENLLAIVEEANVKAQVGHIERFNPAFMALKNQDLNPVFIESHRLAKFNPRGTDVSVVLDLMIHDIDVVLSMVRANVKKISANGVAVISETPDIANARIEFDNGCAANLTASRISLKDMRKMRLFQKNAYLSIDFLNKDAEVIKLNTSGETPTGLTFDLDHNGIKKQIILEKPTVEPINAIKHELELFRDAIWNNTEPEVSVLDGLNALKVAYQIIEKIEKNSFIA